MAEIQKTTYDGKLVYKVIPNIGEKFQLATADTYVDKNIVISVPDLVVYSITPEDNGYLDFHLKWNLNTAYYGTADPAQTLGIDGDIYIKY